MPFLRIIEILKVEPLKVTCLWNNGEIRLSDFTDKIAIIKENERLKPLLDFDIFSQVSINQGNTLCWMNINRVNIHNPSLPFIPLAFDPDRLFIESVIDSFEEENFYIHHEYSS